MAAEVFLLKQQAEAYQEAGMAQARAPEAGVQACQYKEGRKRW